MIATARRKFRLGDREVVPGVQVDLGDLEPRRQRQMVEFGFVIPAEPFPLAEPPRGATAPPPPVEVRTPAPKPKSKPAAAKASSPKEK